MKKIKFLLKIFAFIFIIKASFLFSFGFLGDDLGLDLYKKIDKGINSLENTQYSYELKGGIEGGTITDKVNRILKNKGLGHCEVKNITEEDIKKISFGDIALLEEKLENKCSTTQELSDIKENIKFLRLNTITTAKEKSKQLQIISKIGLYSDGNVKNSPFDIIEDIKKIDEIVFTQKVEYRGGRGFGDNELGNYLKGKIGFDEIDKRLKKLEDDFNKKTSKELKKLNNITEDFINGGNNNNLEEQVIKENNTSDGYVNIIGDQTRLSCPSGENESGLSPEDLKNILNQNNGNYNNNGNSNLNRSIDKNGILNKNYIPYNPGTFGFTTGGSTLGDYSGVNDNNYWGGDSGCDTFFCITVEFITHRGSIFASSSTTNMSIQALLERSNGHLKKFANSSLIQSKMTTNNFELGLKDLDLSEIFSFGMVITKKTPPILDLQGFNDEVKAEGKAEDKKNGVDNNPLSQNNLLKARFEAIKINIKRENDLSIYFDRIGDENSTANGAELNISKVAENYKERKKILSEISDLDLHLDKIISSNSSSSDTDQLYEEFLELERFSSEVQGYTNDLYKIVSKMIEIPINP